jgi:hypothetical protein
VTLALCLSGKQQNMSMANFITEGFVNLVQKQDISSTLRWMRIMGMIHQDTLLIVKHVSMVTKEQTLLNHRVSIVDNLVTPLTAQYVHHVHSQQKMGVIVHQTQLCQRVFASVTLVTRGKMMQHAHNVTLAPIRIHWDQVLV